MWLGPVLEQPSLDPSLPCPSLWLPQVTSIKARKREKHVGALWRSSRKHFLKIHTIFPSSTFFSLEVIRFPFKVEGFTQGLFSLIAPSLNSFVLFQEERAIWKLNIKCVKQIQIIRYDVPNVNFSSSNDTNNFALRLKLNFIHLFENASKIFSIFFPL